MAEHFYALGYEGMLLFLDPAGGTAYDTVVCMDTVDDSYTRALIDNGSACDPAGKLVSPVVESKFTFKGKHLLDPNSGKISGANILDLHLQSTKVGFKLAPTTPAVGDAVITGTAYITSVSNNYAYNAAATFTFELTPNTQPTLTITN